MMFSYLLKKRDICNFADHNTLLFTLINFGNPELDMKMVQFEFTQNESTKLSIYDS